MHKPHRGRRPLIATRRHGARPAARWKPAGRHLPAHLIKEARDDHHPHHGLTRAERLWLAAAALRGALAGAARAITTWLLTSTSTNPDAGPSPRAVGAAQAARPAAIMMTRHPGYQVRGLHSLRHQHRGLLKPRKQEDRAT